MISLGQWWNPVHSWSDDATNLSVELRAVGCFRERRADSSPHHLRGVYAEPGHMLRSTGALGPLQGKEVADAMTETLALTARGIKARLRYALSGRFPDGLGRVVPAVDRVLAEQFAR